MQIGRLWGVMCRMFGRIAEGSLFDRVAEGHDSGDFVDVGVVVIDAVLVVDEFGWKVVETTAMIESLNRPSCRRIHYSIAET